MSYDSTMDRRKFIQGVGVTGASFAIAGCLGDDEDGTGDDDSGDDASGDDSDDSSDDGDEPTFEMPDPTVFGRPAPIMQAAQMAVWPVLHDIFDETHDVELQGDVFSGFTPQVGSLIQGGLHVGQLAALGWVRAVNEGLPVKAFCNFTAFHPSVLITPPDVEWADLEGGTMGIHAPGAAQDVYGPLMVEEELGSVDAMEYEYIIGTPNRIAAMNEGTIDCTMGLISNAFAVEADGSGQYLSAPWEYDRLSNTLGQTWVALGPDLEDDEEFYQTVTDGIVDAYDTVYESDTDEIVSQAYEEYDDYHHAPENAWGPALDEVKDSDLLITDLSEERITKTVDLLHELEFIEEIPDYEDLVTPGFV